MKRYKQPEINKANLSLPTRGGWIETMDFTLSYNNKEVPPHTGRVD